MLMNVLKHQVYVIPMQIVEIHLEVIYVHATLATVGMDLYVQVSYIQHIETYSMECTMSLL